MVSPSRALQFRFESNVGPVKAALADLAASVVSNMATIGTAMAGAGRAAEGGFLGSVLRVIGAIGTLKLAAAGTALAIAGTMVTLRQQYEAMLEIAEKGRKANVSPEFQQSFVAYSKTMRIEAKELEAALNNAYESTKVKLNEVTQVQKQLDNFSSQGLFTKNGNGSDAFDRFLGADTQDARVRIVIEAISELIRKGRELEAINLAETMFGADFAEKIRNGRVQIDGLISTIDRLAKGGADRGEILSNENVQRAEELKNRLEAAGRTMSDLLKPNLNTLHSLSLDLREAWVLVNEAMVAVVRSVNGLMDRLGAIPSGALDLFLAAERYLRAAAGIDPRVFTQGAGRNALPPPAVNAEALTIQRARTPYFSGQAKAAGEEDKFSLDQVERFVVQLEKANEVLRAQIGNIDKSNASREVAVKLAEAEAKARERGEELTQKEREQIIALANAHSNLADTYKDLKQRRDEFAAGIRSIGSEIADGFADAILEGKKLDDVFRDLTKSLARMAIQAAFTGQGPLAGILGFSAPASAGSSGIGGIAGWLTSGFKGFFAEGGRLPANSWGVAGEHGPELIFSGPRPMTVLPNGTGPGGRGGISVQIYSSPVFQAGMTPTDYAAISVALDRNAALTRDMTIDAIRSMNQKDSGALFS